MMKSRSTQSCILEGYRLYLFNFRKIFKSAWLPAVFYALCFSAITTMAVIHYPRLNIRVEIDPSIFMASLPTYRLILIVTIVASILSLFANSYILAALFRLLRGHSTLGVVEIPSRWFWFGRHVIWRVMKGFFAVMLLWVVVGGIAGGLGICIEILVNKLAGRQLIPDGLFMWPLLIVVILFLLPTYFSMYKYILQPNHRFWPSLWTTYREGLRHWGMVFSAWFIANIVILLVSLVVLLPSNILSLANFQANIGMLYGDPLGMPSYILPFTILIMLIAGFVESFIQLTLHTILYYVYGSIETREQEKRNYKKQLDI